MQLLPHLNSSPHLSSGLTIQAACNNLRIDTAHSLPTQEECDASIQKCLLCACDLPHLCNLINVLEVCVQRAEQGHFEKRHLVQGWGEKM